MCPMCSRLGLIFLGFCAVVLCAQVYGRSERNSQTVAGSLAANLSARKSSNQGDNRKAVKGVEEKGHTILADTGGYKSLGLTSSTPSLICNFRGVEVAGYEEFKGLRKADVADSGPYPGRQQADDLQSEVELAFYEHGLGQLTEDDGFYVYDLGNVRGVEFYGDEYFGEMEMRCEGRCPGD